MITSHVIHGYTLSNPLSLSLSLSPPHCFLAPRHYKSLGPIDPKRHYNYYVSLTHAIKRSLFRSKMAMDEGGSSDKNWCLNFSFVFPRGLVELGPEPCCNNYTTASIRQKIFYKIISDGNNN